MTHHTHDNVGIIRRLFAIFYDCFLLAAILFIIAWIANLLNGGQAIEPGHRFYPLFMTIVLSIIYLYFCWFWVNGGQTLGMKTWKIRLIDSQGMPFSWRSATIRFVTAIASWLSCGLGFAWSLFDSKRRGWHDLASNSELKDLR